MCLTRSLPFKSFPASCGCSLFLYVVFLKGAFSLCVHIPLLYLFISVRDFEACSCLPGVQYVLTLAQMILWLQFVPREGFGLVWFFWMVSVDAGSCCWISFLDLCDVTKMADCITVAKTAHFIAVF